MQSKNAIGNLKNRYMAVLKKCNLLNVFGSLAVVSALSIGLAGNVNTAFAAGLGATASTGDTLINDATLTGEEVTLTGISSIKVGIYGYDPTKEHNYNLTNSTNGVIEILNSDREVLGIYANAQSGNFTLANAGKITLSGTSFVYGISTASAGNHTFLNDTGATLSVASSANNAYGMLAIAPATTGNTFTNKGTMTIKGSNGSIFGMLANDTGNHTFLNDTGASLSVKSSNSNVFGMYFSTLLGGSSVGNATFTNKGTMTLEGSYEAVAMYTHATGQHTFTNSGIINVTANNEKTTGDVNALAIGIQTASVANTVTNTGVITVNANAKAIETQVAGSKAYGINVDGADSIISNIGIIKSTATAKGDSTSYALAYEAYGNASFTVGTWATTLRDWSANDAVFGLNNGQTVTFGDAITGATLILRPSSDADGNTILDTKYNVANMVSINDGTGTNTYELQNTIDGSIENVFSEVGFLTANLYNAGTNNPSVSLTKNAAADMPTQAITAQSLNTNLEHIKGVNDVTKNAIANVYNRAFGFDEVSDEIASANVTGLSAGSTSINPWTVFATTYGSYTDNNEYSFDSGSFGVTGGITYNFNEQFALGGHLNFNVSNADSNKFESDSNSFAFGAHSQYFINPNWYVKGSASFAFGDSDVEYTQPIGVAKDEFSSFSTFASLSTGYVYEINENNIIVPEIGLSYLHAENDSYSLDFGAGNEIYKFDMHSNSYDNLYADLSLTWQGNYNLSSSTLSPSVGLGIRQNLTGSDIDASYDLFNNRYETQVSSDDTTFLANAGLQWTKNNFTVSADYEGEFGNEQTSHAGSLNFTFKF